jgi:hypothetical protein
MTGADPGTCTPCQHHFIQQDKIMSSLNDISGIGPATLTGLTKIGITTTEQLSVADVATLTQVRGISEARAERYVATSKMLSAMPDSAPKSSKEARTGNAKAENKAKPAKEKSKAKKTTKTKEKAKTTEVKKPKKDKVKKGGKDKAKSKSAEKETSKKKSKKAKKRK